MFEANVWISKKRKQVHPQPVLYVKLRKAIYGTMKAALLFWTKLTNTIKGMGFEVNSYDECVCNKVYYYRKHIHQDNRSTIILENNGKRSNSKQIKNFNGIFFL
jgi:hypothetical protein